MSLVGITEIVKDMSEKERHEFCDRILVDLARERDSTTTFLAWVAIIAVVAVVAFFVLTWGERLVSPPWLGGRHW